MESALRGGMDIVATDFMGRLKRAGIEPGDDERERLNKTILVFATGLISVTSALWLMIYGAMGSNLSSTLPFVYQLLLTGNLINYIRSGNFRRFRISQLALFLIAPFVMQWAIGDFINSSGVILWGLLAPFGAMVCLGIKESIGWFMAWVGLTLLSGLGDFIPLIEAGANLNIPIKTSTGFFALNFVAVASIIFILLRYSILEKEKIGARLEEAHLQLVKEQMRSEKLLLNILPAPVAARLKDEGQTIADGFDNASVMFVDIVSFTRVAAHLPPHDVFAILNRVFSAFDDLTEKHGLEKIKTIGDAFMVAGGLNLGTTRHVHAMAALALDMSELLRTDLTVNPARLELHIGICTGPVIAGVLGKIKFVYDLWGDTVNVASRITEEAIAGQILCDEQTYQTLQADFEFSEPRIKTLRGRGETPIYQILRRK
ncbi:MAG TPA: adenylate/guanylate cyclase domain-containing protein [Rhodocyclaceae bacterium]|nr:adenylate/guanylate cyclase domain-containing protein [Rhodocyclaceae bacterium]